MSIPGIGAGFALPNIFSGDPSGRPEKINKSPVDEFLEIARQSPEERIRAAILEEMDLSEEDLEAMTAEKRAAMEKQIAGRLKEKLLEAAQEKPGTLVDVTV